MSIGGNLSGISFSGLGSGIDTESIVNQLIQLERLPLQRLQQQQLQIQSRQGIYTQFRSQLNAFKSAAAALNFDSAFNPVSAASSDTAVATVTATSNATAGSFDLAVKKLAQSQKISSDPLTSATTAMGMSGTFTINGKAISIESSDNLSQIAQKINSASAGAVAGVIDGGSGNVYLSITSTKSGAKNTLVLADVGSSTILSDLGLNFGAPAIRQPIPNGAASMKFSSSTGTINSFFGGTGLPGGTVNIGSGSITIDPSADSLQSIVNKINDPANATGVTATVQTESKDGVTSYWIEVTGTSTPAMGDLFGMLQALGFVQKPPAHSVVNAQDAEFTLDGVALTSESNSVTTAIPGATITLLKANATTPEKSTLTLSRDVETIKKSIKSFADAYNAVSDFVKQNSAFDKDTFQSGPLFGDATAQSIENTVNSLLFGNVNNLSGPYKNLSDLGFSFDQDGKLTVDDTALTTAINANPNAVADVLRTSGKGSSNSIKYVSSTSKTAGSSGAGYQVKIDQIATKGFFQHDSGSGLVTFAGNLFGSSSTYQIVLSGDATADMNKVNGDAKLRELVTATVEDGKLVITSKKFGTKGNFTVTSDTVTGKYIAGVDVAGKINNETATGDGQFLTGDIGNASTEGLQIQYTGTDLGNVGYISINKGIAAQANGIVESLTEAKVGLLSTTDDSLQSQIDDLKQSMDTLQTRISAKEQLLRQKFLAMEQAINQMKSQQSRLSALNSG